MKIFDIRWSGLAVAIIMSSSGISYAQQPICAPPIPSQTYLAVCRPNPGVVYGAIRFLSMFSVDHLFKPPPPPFSYTITDLIAPIVGRNLIERDDFHDYIDGLASVKFTRLDASTGTLSASFEEVERTFDTEFGDNEEQSHLSLRLPSHLEGGYWRAPDVLQMAFWKDHRPSFVFKFADGQIVESDVACISLSAGNLKIDLGDEDQPGILVSFGDCE